MTAWRKEENAMSKYEPIVNNFKMDAGGDLIIDLPAYKGDANDAK